MPKDLLPVIIEREGATLPEGCDSWGLKSVRPDLRTYGDFLWPLPGGAARSDDAIDPDNTGSCPKRPGDGLCVATSWQGMASGGIPARTLLLVAYTEGNVLGVGLDAGKLRVRGDVVVVALVDGQRLLVEAGRNADLRNADLRNADLRAAVGLL